MPPGKPPGKPPGIPPGEFVVVEEFVQLLDFVKKGFLSTDWGEFKKELERFIDAFYENVIFVRQSHLPFHRAFRLPFHRAFHRAFRPFLQNLIFFDLIANIPGDILEQGLNLKR